MFDVPDVPDVLGVVPEDESEKMVYEYKSEKMVYEYKSEKMVYEYKRGV
jgi:hypothetical protein